MTRPDLLKQVIHGRSNIHVGKKGITKAVVREVIAQLKKKKILKIRFLELSGYGGIEQASELLANATNSTLVETRGNTCILQH